MPVKVNEASPKKELGSYLRVKEHICNQFRPGDKLPPEMELAKNLGLSRYATLRGLTELQAEGYIERQQGRGTFVAQRLPRRSEKSSALIGLMLPNFTSPLTMEIAEGLVQKLKSQGRNLVLWGTHGEFEAEAEYFAKVDEVGLDGLIWWPQPMMEKHEALQRLAERKFPMVMLDSPYPGIDSPYVFPDHYGGMKKVVEFLIRLGHKRIAFLTNDAERRLTIPAVKERERAYFDAMKEAGLPVDPEWLAVLDPDLTKRLNTDPRIDDFVPYEPTHKLISLNPRPTAIVLIHDQLAIGAVRAIKNAGLRIPTDISLASFGDLPVCRMLDVPLATAHYPAHELGVLAAELMEKLINCEPMDHLDWRLPVELVIRGSVTSVSES